MMASSAANANWMASFTDRSIQTAVSSIADFSEADVRGIDLSSRSNDDGFTML